MVLALKIMKKYLGILRYYLTGTKSNILEKNLALFTR
jgi:hypothetical protein